MQISQRVVRTGLLTLLIATSTASTADWRRVTANDDLLVHLDMNGLRLRSNRLSAWVMIDFANPKENPGSDKSLMMRSSVSLWIFDCASERTAIVASTAYHLESGSGDVLSSWNDDISSAKLEYAIPDSVASAVLDFACKTYASMSKDRRGSETKAPGGTESGK